jgi:hypothetical protein
VVIVIMVRTMTLDSDDDYTYKGHIPWGRALEWPLGGGFGLEWGVLDHGTHTSSSSASKG